MTKIGLIGTGMLGNAVGLHLIESGQKLFVYNRTKDKTLELEEKGAEILFQSKTSSRKIGIGHNGDKRRRCCKASSI